MKTLFLLRHAKTEPVYDGIDDAERKLLTKGRDDARSVGEYMRDHNHTPQAIYSSDAMRTKETAELVQPLIANPPKISFKKELYLPSPGEIIALINRLDESLNDVLLVSHNPGIHQTANFLVSGGESADLDLLARSFPPAALAVLECDVESWERIGPASCQLVALKT